MARSLRFLQLSDVHLGSSLAGGRLRLSEERAATRREERRQAFSRAMDLVLQRDLDGVLLPGDLFDDESITRDQLRFVQHHLERIAPRPVFVAPGNHDPFGGPSPYNRRLAEGTLGSRWPSNVHLFAHEDIRALPWPGRDDVFVHGCGVLANVPSETRRLAEIAPRREGALNLLLFHGSRDDGQWLQANKSTYPFSRQELLAQEMDWVALGHYHGHQLIDDDSGRPRAAYAGSLFAGGLDEIGPKGVIIVELGDAACSVEFVALDPREVRKVRCDLTGSGFSEDALARARRTLADAGTRSQDLVLLELTGRRAPGLELERMRSMAEDYFHLRIDSSSLVPDVPLADYPSADDAITVEQRFVARLRERVESGDPVARRALLYGLDALKRGRIDTFYSD